VLAFLNIGPFELLLLGAAAVLLFGGDLPDVARKAAVMAGRLRAMTGDLTREMQGRSDLRSDLRRPPELDLAPSERRTSPEPWKTPTDASSSPTVEAAGDSEGDAPPNEATDGESTEEGGSGPHLPEGGAPHST